MKDLLACVLVEILSEKPLGNISIKEICEKAGVSKMSFYRSFKDKYDCLDHAIELVFLERGALRSKSIAREILNWMTTIKEHRNFFLNILEYRDGGTDSFIEQCTLYLEQELEGMVLKKSGKRKLSQKQKNLIKYNAAGMTRTVLEWVRCGCSSSARATAENIMHCMSQELKDELSV